MEHILGIEKFDPSSHSETMRRKFEIYTSVQKFVMVVIDLFLAELIQFLTKSIL